MKTDFGLVGISHDPDGFLRRYIIYQKFPDSDKYNYSLAIEAALKYYNEDSESLKPFYDKSTRKINIGDNISIDTYGQKSSFLLNYYGPSSKALGAAGTFGNNSLVNILDDEETCSGISDEWELCSPVLFQTTDIAMYNIINNGFC